MKLILLRHGESEWNLLNKFTGWTDVGLTEDGVKEAQFAGQQLIKHRINIQSLNTSHLERAIRTAKIVSEIINFDLDDINYDWRLNERHYGALQGLNKSDTAKKYGEDQVKMWRRSYDIPPPSLLEADNQEYPQFSKKFNNLNFPVPCGESLKDVINRMTPFWEQYFNSLKGKNDNHLIVAHSNSLRAIVKILEKLSSKEIISVNIPTGVPLVYEFDNHWNILNKKYLINNDVLLQKQDSVAKQGLIK